MGKRKIRILLAMTGMLFLSGCQATPEESSVASKAEGLSEDVIAEPMKDGETRKVDIPEHWTASEKKSNDRVTISVDMQPEPMETGNLPVKEMKNASMSQKDLKNLVMYFAGNETLYHERRDTKADYEKEIERIKNKEGAYADPVLYTYYQAELKENEQAVELAPEVELQEKMDKVEFQKRRDDPVRDAGYESLPEAYREELLKKNEKDIFFSADVGKERTAHIRSENYSEELANTGRFEWLKGDIVLNEEIVTQWIEAGRKAPGSAGETEYDRQELERLLPYENLLKEEGLSLQTGQKQAEEILTDLDISDVELSMIQKALWFPKGAFIESGAEDLNNQIWKADLTQAEVGYEYAFTRGAGGIYADQLEGSRLGTETFESFYAPPFPVEKISIVVTATGVKSFVWEGMCEETAVIAENTKLLPFAKIEERLFDYIYYDYTMHAQPAENQAEFTFEIYDIKLGYTYVPAFQNPKNAWLVPAWFVKAKKNMDASTSTGEVLSMGTTEIMVNALDGGFIAYPAS